MSESQENFIARFFNAIQYSLEKPVEWFREKVVLPNQQQYPWYHQKYRRVPTIDECYSDDYVCIFEANIQYQRDRMVDTNILTILKQRHQDCFLWNMEDNHLCDHLNDAVEDAATNWNIKHGDLGPKPHVQDAYMKQKHRMVWERRHGPVGSGMKTPDGSKME